MGSGPGNHAVIRLWSRRWFDAVFPYSDLVVSPLPLSDVRSVDRVHGGVLVESVALERHLDHTSEQRGRKGPCVSGQYIAGYGHGITWIDCSDRGWCRVGTAHGMVC